MTDIIDIAERRAARSFTDRLIVDAPVEAERLGEPVRYPGWVCALIIIGMAAGVWAMFVGACALLAGG